MQVPARVRKVRFGAFEVDLLSGELHKQGIKIKLHDQPFQVLAMLLEQPGELVSREQLRQKLWPADTFVDFDVGLNSAIKRLRDALSDSAESPRYIETLPRRGYRFIASVEGAIPAVAPGPLPSIGTGQAEAASVAKPAEDAPAGAKPGLRPRSLWGLALTAGASLALLLALNSPSLHHRVQGTTTPIKIRSLAVLPFENLSRDADQEYFADGMTEELITDLGKIAGLRVISRTSSMHYKGTRKTLPEIARELNVDAVVVGAVLRSGDHVRITTQLVEAASDRHLWAESYERELRDVLTLQGEVARDVAKQVNIKLSREEQTRFASAHSVDPEALEAYLKGRYELDKMTLEGMKKSVDYFAQALDKDPTYARAWAGLSEALSFPFVPRDSDSQEVLAKAKAAALKALELDGTLSEGHLSLGLVLERDWLWSGAEKEYQRAIALDSNNARAHGAYGRYLMGQGRLEEAIAETRRAQELDPLSPLMHRDLARALSAAGRYDEALAQYREVAALGGAMSYPTHRRMALAYERKGMEREALDELLAALRTPRNWLESTPSLPEKVGDRAAKQLAAQVEQKYASSGYPEAKSVFLHGDVLHVAPSAGPIWTAADYAELGLKDKAFEWLNKAIELRNINMEFIKVDERFVSLRSDPRFGEVLRRIGLPN